MALGKKSSGAQLLTRCRDLGYLVSLMSPPRLHRSMRVKGVSLNFMEIKKIRVYEVK